MFVLCVAPLRDVDPYHVKGKNVFGNSDFDTAFSSRAGESASLTRPRAEATIATRAEMLKVAAQFDGILKVSPPTLYNQQEMHLLVSLVEVRDDALLRPHQIERFEQITTRIFEEFTAKHYSANADSAPSVRWVNRTLLLPRRELSLEHGAGEPALPQRWFQQDEKRKVTLSKGAEFHASWGNNVLVYHPDHGRDFGVDSVVEPLIHAQYLWCYLTDIERISLGYLELLGSGRKVRDRLVRGVIDLHFELAMESVMRERTRTEAQPQFREAVESVLEAWGYEEVHDDVDRRLQRLEHIVQGRSELIQRTQSKIMEATLFVLGALTLVSLAISLIQTAFAEVGTDDSGIRPGGIMFEWMRNADATSLVAWSLVISVVVIVAVRLWPKAVNHRQKKEGHGIYIR